MPKLKLGPKTKSCYFNGSIPYCLCNANGISVPYVLPPGLQTTCSNCRSLIKEKPIAALFSPPQPYLRFTVVFAQVTAAQFFCVRSLVAFVLYDPFSGRRETKWEGNIFCDKTLVGRHSRQKKSSQYPSNIQCAQFYWLTFSRCQ